MAEKKSSQAPPSHLGQYEILRRLGAGGMAEVFLAKKRGAEGTYKLLVLKRVLPVYGNSRRFRQMFVAEAQLATRLNHPNIVQVYDFQDIGEEGQLLSMEYVEGPDLGRIMSIARKKKMRIPHWVGAYIIAEAAKGLHYAHERKDEAGAPLAIVHRDVSPQNILISYDGSVKIADFGIASANMFREEKGVLKGKFGYMSPEQAQGAPVDRRSDIYALGVCLYEMLTNRYLHGELAGDALLEAVRGGMIEPPSSYVRDIPPELEEILMRALAKSRDSRFQTARELSGAISRAILARQTLVDGHSIDTMVSEIVGRDFTAHGIEVEGKAQASGASPPGALSGEGAESQKPPAQRTMAAVPVRKTGATGAVPHRPDGQRVNREVRHVAVAKLELYGVPELKEAVGEERAKVAVEQVKRILNEIAYKRGAEWGWPSPTRASGIIGLLASYSRAAAQAASMAVDIHEALAGTADDLPVPLRASIGIARGIAAGERDEQGCLARAKLQAPAELLANLLGEQAPAGTTWVAGGLYRLVRRDFRWADAPSIDLGHLTSEVPLPRAMRVYALTRPLSREERLAELAMAPSDLMGRDAEKAELHSAFHKAVPRDSERPPQVVSLAVVGEMGIGKSALVGTFLAELPPHVKVIRTESNPARVDLPLAGVSDLVRDALGIEADAPINDVKNALDETLEPFPQLRGSTVVRRLAELATNKHSDANDEDDLVFRRKLLASGIRRVFASLALKQPLVIVCEGLQWADKQSLDLIRDLTRPGDPLPILALLVTRPEERVMPFLDGVMRIDLGGLSREDQIRLVGSRLGVREGVAAICADLVPRVAGNPFFLLEMIDALLERGALELTQNEEGEQELVRVEGPGDRREALPSTLEQIIGDRLAELPPEEALLVNWLAVAGGPLTRSDLDELTGGLDNEAVMRLFARGVCDQRNDSMDFRHTIARDVAYMAIDRGDRQFMHRRLGEYLADSPLAEGLSAAIVAKHLARGKASSRAAEHYLIAAKAARGGYQTQLATRYYQRALGLLPREDFRRLPAHEALEAIYRVLGRKRERKKHLAQLRGLASASRKARWVAMALVRSARLDLDENNLEHGLVLARQAAQAARASHDPVIEIEAENIASELMRDSGDMAGALAACDRALAVTESHREVPARARAEVLRARGILLRHMGRVHESVHDYAEAIAVFRKVGARRHEARAKNALAYAMFVLEKWEDAIALALSSISIDLAIGGRFQIAKTLANVGQAHARLGDFPRALAYLRRARDAHERYGDQDKRADTLLVTAEALIEAGDLEVARLLVSEVSTLNSLKGNLYDTIHEKIVRALVARAEGDPAAAMRFALDARQKAEEQALASFHLYATAIEAVCKTELGEVHTGILLASTAVSAVDTIPSEYGLEIRALSCRAFELACSPAAKEVRQRCAAHALGVAERIRDKQLRVAFLRRRVVQSLTFGKERHWASDPPPSKQAAAPR